MRKDYILNPDTHCLHIRGYCVHTKNSIPQEYKRFATQDEAAAFDGGTSVRMCKICQKKRDALLKESRE